MACNNMSHVGIDEGNQMVYCSAGKLALGGMKVNRIIQVIMVKYQ
jgi:hypothetical protein